RSPCGVAMGVSGDAHLHNGQPTGQVPLTGWVHAGPMVIGPGTTQQSSPCMQHVEAQQSPVAPQLWGVVQGAMPHLPWSQSGSGPWQTVPQVPQFLMSLPGFTQVLPQQMNGAAQLLALQPVDPELLDVVVVPLDVVVVPLVVVPLVDCVVV